MPSQSSGNVNVVCRVRPLNQSELSYGTTCCLDFLDDKTVQLKLSKGLTSDPETTKNEKLTYSFDRVFSPKTEQVDIYKFAAEPVVDAVLQGFNGTIFAYG